MLRRPEVTIGKCYVNDARNIAREVVSANDETVRFYNYHMMTGNSCGSPSECARDEFIRWADREATPAEMASLHYQEMDALFSVSQPPSLKELDHNVEIELAATALMQMSTLNR
jgi:hypothetical protein